MATYKNLKGFKVKSLSSDPTVDAGQIWYNTTSNTLKYDGAAAGAWSSGGSLSTGREAMSNSGSSQTSTLVFGGSTQPANDLAVTEEYNGTAWTEKADLNTGRAWSGGAGSITAAYDVSGANGTPPPRPIVANTEEWDGTSWAEANNCTTGRTYAASAGTATAGLFTGGAYTGGPGSGSGLTEEWNGTCWAEVADLANATENGRGDGTQTAAYTAGGGPVPRNNNVEQYNGTAWTEVGDITLGRGNMGASGTTTLSLIMGGYPPVGETAVCEQYDGSSWTTVASLATARAVLTGSGTNAPNSLAVGGYKADYIYGTWTEEWDGAPAAVRTVTVS